MIKNENDKTGQSFPLVKPTAANSGFFGTGNIQRIALVPASSSAPTDDQALWGAIRHRAGASSFVNFEKFIADVFCQDSNDSSGGNIGSKKPRDMIDAAVLGGRVGSPCYHGSEAYNLLKASAEVFLALQCGIKVDIPLKNKQPDVTAKIPGETDRGTTNETFGELQAALEPFVTGKTRLYLHTILNSLKLGNANSPLCAGILRPKVVAGGTTDLSCYPCMLELISLPSHSVSKRRLNPRRAEGKRNGLGE